MRNRFILRHVCAANWKDHKETKIQMFSSQNGFFCPWANTVIRRAHTHVFTLARQKYRPWYLQIFLEF